MAHALRRLTAALRRRRALGLLLVLYVASAALVGLQRTRLSYENNFAIFRTAFHHLIAGRDMYAAYPAAHTDLFKYSPTFALLFAPFAVLPIVPGFMLWAVTGAVSVFAGVTRILPARQAALALSVAWLSVVGDMQRAQSNALCAGLMLLAFAALERQTHYQASTAIAAGTFVKLFPLAAIAGAIFHPRKAHFVGVFSAVTAVFAAVPLLVVSPASLLMQYRSWFAIERSDATQFAARYGTSGGGLYAGVMGQFRVWWDVDWPNWPTQALGLTLLLLPLAWRRSQWSNPRFRLQFVASTLVFCVLFNHQAESPSFVIAMIGTSIWFASSTRAWWRTILLLCAITIVNLGSTDLVPSVWYRAYYVKYLLKTVPLIPIWLVMQGELLGLFPNGPRSQTREADEHDVTAGEALLHRT